MAQWLIFRSRVIHGCNYIAGQVHLVRLVRLVRLQMEKFRLFLHQQNGKQIKEKCPGFRFPFETAVYLYVYVCAYEYLYVYVNVNVNVYVYVYVYI